MKDIPIPNNENPIAANPAVFAARGKRGKYISREKMARVFADIRQLSEAGELPKAEKIILETIETFSVPVETRSLLCVLLSETLEKQGRFAESLAVLKFFEADDLRGKLKPRSLIPLFRQTARAHTNANDPEAAAKLLNAALEAAESNRLENSIAAICLELARAYRQAGKPSAARNYAENALKTARALGERQMIAESHLALGKGYLGEGSTQKALDFFEQALKIAGAEAPPPLVGEIHANLAEAHAALRRPAEAIAALRKAIGVFEKTGQRHCEASARQGLGANLLIIGEWGEAEKVLRRALEIAFETGELIADVLSSLGELKLLQNQYADAEKLLTRAFDFAERRKSERAAAESLKTSARLYLMREMPEKALSSAAEASRRAEKIDDAKLKRNVRLVVAQCLLQTENFAATEEILNSVEETAQPDADFSALGEIYRMRGLIALARQSGARAVECFSRSLSIFETTQDLYNMALLNYEIGRTIARTEPGKAVKHLTSATDTFRLLGAESLSERGERELEKAKNAPPAETRRETSAGSQLLMLRLAEAVASRELLFRELVTVLQQESRATKIVLAEQNEQGKFYPFIIQGFTPAESIALVEKTEKAIEKNDLENFAAEKYLNVFHLRPPSAPPAILILYPAAGGKLADGSPVKPLLRVVELGMDVCALREKDRAQNEEAAAESPFVSNSLLPGFIHSSPAMTALVEEVYRIRSSDVTVLITGESGTGKELVARAIHTLSRRKDKVFIPFNCTAVPRELAESYFFGAKKGSYTGAFNDTPGMIRTADGGTLFLDEVGDLPLEIQPKLLRFLQEGEIHPVGERKPIGVDVRIIAATNTPLEGKVGSGAFREDLYYRLNVIRLHVPPLRERRSEIPQIANYYLNYYSAKFARRDLVITPQTMDLLTAFDWQGNVRQLSNEVQRLVARANNGEKITPKQLSPELQNSAAVASPVVKGNVKSLGSIADTFKIEDGTTLEDAVSELEKRMINDAMKRHGGNITRVARELGLTRRGLYLKLERYRIPKTA